MPRVLILDPLAQEGLALLKQAEGVEFEVRTGLKGDALRSALAEFDGAICRSGVQITAASLEGNRRLKAIVRAGVGTDNIDFKAAKQLGIVVMNTPMGNTLSTAEHTLALMFALARHIPPAAQSINAGQWDRKSFMGNQLAGKTLGIVGLGRIGQAVATRAKALEMRVLGFDPFLSSQRAKELGIEVHSTVKSMLPEVDYLTVHTPLTKDTKHLIGMAELDLLKPGARLINCARGEIYDEAALVEGLKSGKLSGVALDVFAEEPPGQHPLFGMKGFIGTPHLGASTHEAQTSVAVEAVELLIAYLKTGAVRHAVNMPPIDPQTLERLRPYLNLTYRLGLLTSQLAGSSPLKSCELIFRGEIAGYDTGWLSASLAAGLLQTAAAHLDYEINIVNAEEILRQRGVTLTRDQQQTAGDFSSMVVVKTTTDDGHTQQVAGTVFGQTMPRWVRFNQFRMEAYLDGTLLVFRHRDVPGIIGSVGTLLGQHHVNIAQMAVGREKQGGDAIGVLNVDQEPTPAALTALQQHPEIRTCEVIHLPAAGELPGWMGS